MTCQNSPLTRVETADQSEKKMGIAGSKGWGSYRGLILIRFLSIPRFDTHPFFFDPDSMRWWCLWAAAAAAAAAAGARAGNRRRRRRRHAGMARLARARVGEGGQHDPVYTARGPAHFLNFFLMPKVMISQSGVEVVLVFRPF